MQSSSFYEEILEFATLSIFLFLANIKSIWVVLFLLMSGSLVLRLFIEVGGLVFMTGMLISIFDRIWYCLSYTQDSGKIFEEPSLMEFRRF